MKTSSVRLTLILAATLLHANLSHAEQKPVDPIKLYGLSFTPPQGWFLYPKYDDICSTPGGRSLLNLVPARSFRPDPSEDAMFTVETATLKAPLTSQSILNLMSELCVKNGAEILHHGEEVHGGINFANLTTLTRLPERRWISDMYATTIQIEDRVIYYAFFLNFSQEPRSTMMRTKQEYLDAMLAAIKSVKKE